MKMVLNTAEDVIPLVGLYVAIASLVCTLAMAADAFQGFRQWKLWFPCRFFTINAASITLIAIAMKLPVDLTTDMNNNPYYDPKSVGVSFLVTMLANFLPSLGLMDDKELILNIIAMGILLITITVNVCIQTITKESPMYPGAMVLMILCLPWSFSVALTVSASRRILEHRYKELHKPNSNSQEIKRSFKELECLVKRYWMMAETGNPQFVIICSPILYASGILCFSNLMGSLRILIELLHVIPYFPFCEESSYKWSIYVIVIVQSIGIVVGSISPIFRCLMTISYFNLSKKWSKNYLNILRVERYWTQRLQQWKRSRVRSHIPGRHCKMVFHSVKNIILNICITLQILVVVICKMICFGPRSFLILFFYCCYQFNSLLKRFIEKPNASNNNVRSEIEEYTNWVLQVEEEAKFSKRLLRNALNTINQVIQEFEKKETGSLIKLLEKSTRLRGVVEFDNDQVPPLHPEEIHNCWSLVTVTLTAIALALPNIANSHVKELLDSMREGLRIVRPIEKSLIENDKLVHASKAARRVWTDIEVYRKWLQIDVLKKARKGKTSKEILQWLGDEAAKIVIEFKRCKKGNLNHSFYKFVAASSMYRISQTILLHCNEQENWPQDEEAFEWISTTIADILCACFTNIPRVITMKCHHKTIEKRKESIRVAAQLLGKSKKILNILEERQLPDLDLESMAYIDKWHALPHHQIPEVLCSSSCNESLIIRTV